jgi:AraC-like DNA-binding protein
MRLNETRIQPRIRVEGAGAVLNDDFGVSVSVSAALAVHRRHGAAIYVAVDGDVAVKLATGPTIRDRVVVVPPHVWHAVACAGPIVMLSYDPEGAAPVIRGTRRRSDSDGTCRLEPGLGSRMSGAVKANRASLSRSDVLGGIGRELASWLEDRSGHGRPDPRVAAVADALRDPVVDRRRLVARLGISPAHLRELFAKEVGLPMRTFQRWHRLLHAMAAMVRCDATTAAHEAGFADLAHFSRTCREMFGDSPTGLVGKLVIA